MFLRELTNSIDNVKGIGAATAKHLQAAGITMERDLLLYYPRAYEDRTARASFASIGDAGIVNTVIDVEGHSYIGFGRKKTLKVTVSDESDTAHLVCFGRNFLSRTFTPGKKFHLYGTFTRRFGELSSSSFEVEALSDRPKNFGRILPVYPLVGRLTLSFFRKTVAELCRSYCGEIECELPAELKEKRELINKSSAIRTIHFPENTHLLAKARQTLVYEELFYLQLAIQRRAQKNKSLTRQRRRFGTDLLESVVRRLPFTLTRDQINAIEEIKHDMESQSPMSRLLQGDVGCGKTLVALLCSLLSAEAGVQVAFMAPTELLARQHAEQAAKILEPAGIQIAFLSGNVKQEGRRGLLRALENGEIDLILGTHALFTEDVKFSNLGLVIVDEQQRFGVLQRMALLDKGTHPDLLLMTATPIPRTLALTVFGDLEVSTIRTMPPGRKPVETHLVRKGNEGKLYDWIRKELAGGHQAYFVYPLIQQSAKLDLKDAESMYNHLAKHVFPDRKVAIIHSKVDEDCKKDTMHNFARGAIDILVATSVVEVGVNVPNATCMVIEQAERFGLSALHQLRGRVGRAQHQSYSFLVYGDSITEDAKQRLKVMKEQNDGFRIAEEDLLIRGPGELTGRRQSGYFKLTIADIVRDLETMQNARIDAARILDEDPDLSRTQNGVVREVLERAAPFTDEFAAGG